MGGHLGGLRLLAVANGAAVNARGHCPLEYLFSVFGGCTSRTSIILKNPEAFPGGKEGTSDNRASARDAGPALSTYGNVSHPRDGQAGTLIIPIPT